MALSTSQKIEKGKDLKNEGNGFFVKGEYQKGTVSLSKRKNQDPGSRSRSYHQALLYVKGLENSIGGMFGMPDTQGLSNEDYAVVLKIQGDAYNNMAASYIRTNNFEKAVDYASKVLVKDPENAKALYRRGTAYHRLNNLEKAEKDLKAAVKFAPNDKAIRQELELISKAYAEYEKKSKLQFAGMFDKKA